ncbi:unnamed protein product [Allacma fusca]|uniref:Uncharacterized protein n=1 Tax=Allacma fusca TaxID=39272 RepID=A0A8J2M9T3_9HEXA|nr:unnamed protein product [Allacma fusca]
MPHKPSRLSPSPLENFGTVLELSHYIPWIIFISSPPFLRPGAEGKSRGDQVKSLTSRQSALITSNYEYHKWNNPTTFDTPVPSNFEDSELQEILTRYSFQLCSDPMPGY